MKNCIRCKKEKKTKKRALFGANDLKLHISKYNLKKKKKNLRIVYQIAIIFKKLNQMDTKLEKTLKKEIIWCMWDRRLHTPNGIVRISKRFGYPCLKINK